jgi:general stress protein 26
MAKIKRGDAFSEQEHVHQLLTSFRDVFLGVFEPAGDRAEMRGRPMAIARVDEDCTLYFMTEHSATKAEQAALDPRAHVFGQAGARFLALRGAYHLTTDRALLTSLWSKPMDVWFKGPEDPRACALVFTPSEAELWDASGVQGLRYLFAAAKALVTGERPATNREQHTRTPIAH